MNELKSNSVSKLLHIVGLVTKPVSFPIGALKAMDQVEMHDLPILCGSGEIKGKLTQCKGVLLADLINLADVIIQDHNDTKKMFIVASADDGYATIFSWQEIFNSPNGDGVIVLLEKNGRSLLNEENCVDIISIHDHLTGPRYVHQLSTLSIRMID